MEQWCPTLCNCKFPYLRHGSIQSEACQSQTLLLFWPMIWDIMICPGITPRNVFYSTSSDQIDSFDLPVKKHSKVIAPNMLNLANQGTIITDMYVQPVCTPSRSALMTSRKKLQILEIIMIHSTYTFIISN